MQKLFRFYPINFLIFFFSLNISAQKIERVEPPNWWVGMESTSLQLMIYGENISLLKPSISNKNIQITKVHLANSPNYLFVDIEISNTEEGNFDIDFLDGSMKKLTYTYELKDRIEKSQDRIGFNSSDVIYLITPDRFANADPSNDQIAGLKEQTVDRGDDYKRHGGDIKGITTHLNYIEEMGFTAIWPCPVVTNDMYSQSYHGYAMTDFYQIDPRFGTLDDYLELSKRANEKGVKLIMDQVVNHCGLEHWWMKDLPFENWINDQQNFEEGKDIKITNHRRTTNQDTYASLKDSKLNTEGWFVSSMPDLNQRNEFMATYLIQNSIWWVEVANLKGIRQDTYPYPDKEFLSNWAGAIMNEYPNFSIVGEEWSTNPLLVGYWQEGTEKKDGYRSNLTSTMDFPMQQLIVEGLKEKETWGTGLVKIYEGLANDFAYSNPEKIMIFPDNHDMSRIYTQLDEDNILTKMALSYQLVLPRIPQIYYGTELLMNDTSKPGDHGLIRSDFPGGWKNDTINGFTGEGLSEAQLDMQNYLKTILNFRKESLAIHQGKTVHFAPEEGVYVLFRISDDEIVVHILNKNTEAYTLDLSRFEEVGLNGEMLKNIQTNQEFIWKNELTLTEKGSFILTTKL